MKTYKHSVVVSSANSKWKQKNKTKRKQVLQTSDWLLVIVHGNINDLSERLGCVSVL